MRILKYFKLSPVYCFIRRFAFWNLDCSRKTRVSGAVGVITNLWVWIGFTGLFLVFPPEISATSYYVSATGNNNNPGTLNQPFKTIAKGITVLKAGDILYVRSGTYIESLYVGQSGRSDAPITIREYPGEAPVLDGSDQLPSGNWGSLVNLNGNYIHFSGFEVKNSNITGRYLGGEGVSLGGHHTKASRLNVHHTWEAGIIASGDFSIVEDCVVWQCAFSNSANPGNSGSSWATGISAARSEVDGITTNAILRRNITFNNWGEGLSSFEAEGTLIEDNITYDNWSVNLYVSDTRDAIVQRNLIYNTPDNVVGQRRPFTLGDERPDKPRSANTIVINNLIYNADFWAFWSTSVPGSGLDNVLIAHNTLINGQLEIGENDYDGVVNKSAWVYNNIFYHETNQPFDSHGPMTNIAFSHNLWSELPPSELRGDNDLTGDPQFAKVGSTEPGELKSYYFKLLETSPAINAGMSMEEVTSDFFRGQRDNLPDIGAHEFGAVVISSADNNQVIGDIVTCFQSRIYLKLGKEGMYDRTYIYDLRGHSVVKQSVTDLAFSIDVSGFAKGIYIVVLEGDKAKSNYIVANF